MCGIAGEFRFSTQPSTINWNHVTDLMHRRGPDDDGYWNDDNVTLVFKRLAILDLNPTAHQPMLSQDQSYAITFNGELYNYRELKRELQQYGITFRSTGDTEVVLYSLIVWGRQALSRFNGMFALAFYDRNKKSILLARDHAGIKPLYFSQQGESVIFASQYNQILTHPQVRNRNISRTALALYLRLGFIPAPYAALETTHMLLPGHWLNVDGKGQITQGRYFEYPRETENPLPREEAYEAIDSAIRSAVRRQMVCDVPLGAFLSGGIDSPLVVAKMAQLDADSVHTFTIASTDSSTDESGDAYQYAKALGVKQTIEPITPGNVLDMVDDALTACGEPFADYSIFPTLLVSKSARHNFTVMLSGDGGDELFWGYPERQAPLLENCENFKSHHLIRKLIRLTGKLKRQTQQQGHKFANLGEWQINCHRFINEQLLRDVLPNAPALPNNMAFNAGWLISSPMSSLRFSSVS